MNSNYTTTTSNQHKRFGRTVFAAAVAASAAFAVTVPTSASAAHPADENPTQRQAATQGTVTSPCFAVRPPDRWAADAGQPPQCTHAFGRVTAFSSDVANDRQPAAVDSPCFMNPRHWSVTFDGGVPVCTPY